jgi:hypothetical protein
MSPCQKLKVDIYSEDMNTRLVLSHNMKTGKFIQIWNGCKVKRLKI